MHLARLVASGCAFALTITAAIRVTSAQQIDANTVTAKAIVREIQSCHSYMSAHPDVAKSYGNISIDSYCRCEANLLIGSVSPAQLVRSLVDGNFEAAVGIRRQQTGLYCLGMLLKPDTPGP